MARRYRQDVERGEFSMRQRGTLDAIQLKASVANRHQLQQRKIDDLLKPSDEQNALRDQPEQFMNSLSNDQKALLDQQPLLMPAFIRHWGPEKNLCLFNIIVAFEWIPNYNDLRLLREATSSASALLYDVTDGYMAIGYVCVGGPQLLSCADIQIFASNRLFPRSTVDGLNEPHKYQPIRLGRGLWHKNSRISLPWDSELGFATLIHEWGHYALGLKDQYLEVKPGKRVVIPVRNPVHHTIMAGPDKDELLGTNLSAQATSKSEWLELSKHSTFTWLEISGNHVSEDLPPPQQLTPAFRLIGALRNEAIREEQIEKGGANKHHDRYEQPHPILCWEQLENTIDPKDEMSPDHCWVYVIEGTLSNPKRLTAQGEVEQVGALIDHTINGPALRLLGAKKHDLIVLVGHRQPAAKDQKALLEPLVLCAEITGFQDRNKVETSKWANVTPEPMPKVAVQCSDPQNNIDDLPTYTLELDAVPEDWEVHICPFGEQEALFSAQTREGITALDGHVLLVKCQGDKCMLAIAGYSLGGSPDSGFPVHPNPVPAGSSDGNAMLFFYNPGEDNQAPGTRSEDSESDTTLPQIPCRPVDYAVMDVKRHLGRLGDLERQALLDALAGLRNEENKEEFDKYRIVVTTNYLAEEDQAGKNKSISVEFRGDPTTSSDSVQQYGKPRSYTFGVTTNLPLTPLEKYFPTLVLYYDNKALFDEPKAVSKEDLEVEQKKLVIARYDPASDEEKWIAWTPDVSQDSVAALPLNRATAPGLFPEEGQQLEPEYFRLLLITE